jgi:hypothetical protein
MAVIHCWDYPSYDDVPEEYRKHCVTFHADAPGGGCIVACGYCKQTFNDKDEISCPHCNRDLIYPRADW